MVTRHGLKVAAAARRRRGCRGSDPRWARPAGLGLVTVTVTESLVPSADDPTRFKCPSRVTAGFGHGRGG